MILKLASVTVQVEYQVQIVIPALLEVLVQAGSQRIAVAAVSATDIRRCVSLLMVGTRPRSLVNRLIRMEVVDSKVME